MRMAAPESSDCVRARALLIAAVLFISYAYFYEGGGWNQNSRFDLIRAIIEQRTLRIDAYHGNTEDKALYQGHYYSDKAPGLALLALPAVAAVRPILPSSPARRACRAAFWSGSTSQRTRTRCRARSCGPPPQ